MSSSTDLFRLAGPSDILGVWYPYKVAFGRYSSTEWWRNCPVITDDLALMYTRIDSESYSKFLPFSMWAGIWHRPGALLDTYGRWLTHRPHSQEHHEWLEVVSVWRLGRRFALYALLGWELSWSRRTIQFLYFALHGAMICWSMTLSTFNGWTIYNLHSCIVTYRDRDAAGHAVVLHTHVCSWGMKQNNEGLLHPKLVQPYRGKIKMGFLLLVRLFICHYRSSWRCT